MMLLSLGTKMGRRSFLMARGEHGDNFGGNSLTRLFRIQIISEGKKRKLIIKNCKLEDAGMITAKTVGDERSAPLGVKRKSRYEMFCTVVDSVGFKYTFASRRLSKINNLQLTLASLSTQFGGAQSFPKLRLSVMTVFCFL